MIGARVLIFFKFKSVGYALETLSKKNPSTWNHPQLATFLRVKNESCSYWFSWLSIRNGWQILLYGTIMWFWPSMYFSKDKNARKKYCFYRLRSMHFDSISQTNISSNYLFFGPIFVSHALIMNKNPKPGKTHFWHEITQKSDFEGFCGRNSTNPCWYLC